MLVTVHATALQIKIKLEVLLYRHIEIQGGLFGQISDQSFRADGITENIDTRDHRLPRGRGQISRENIHRGTLPRAVRTEETDDLPRFHLKADIIHRTVRAVVLYKMFYFYHKNRISFPLFKFKSANASANFQHRDYCNTKL